MDECSKCKYRKSCEQLNFLDVANDCDDLIKLVDDIRADAIDECIKVMKFCWYNGQQPLNVLVSRLENLKEQK